MAWRAARVRYADVVRLQEALHCPEPVAWVLVRRGLADPAEARAFLASDGPLEPPEAIPGIPEAADRVARAVRGNERIVVHGDYDCDGISSTAILVQALSARGADVRAFLPSRFTDGYGVSVATVERLADEGCDLLVTVDCGTTAVEALTRAAELGIDSVVCDHHLAGGVRPPAIIANPALGRGSDALPAAAGVTFKLVQALAQRLDGDRLAPASEEGIDLVALATVADAVPLVGENRRLVARGLTAFRANPRPGLAALCRAAEISSRGLSARDLGWNLAPAINASGRMSHPDEALSLLLGDDGPTTHAAATALWSLNMERREVEQRVMAEAIAVLEASPEAVRDADALVVAGDGWHEGVVGIVASRMVERFGRPAIVVTIDGDSAKGSGRSLPGVDLHSIVAAAGDHLERWGGHAGAVGLQLPVAKIAAFREAFAAAAGASSAAIRRARIRVVDAVVGVRDLTLRNAEALEALAPFGSGNPEVRLAVPGCQVETAGTMGEGGRHLQLRLRSGGTHARALGWGQGERLASIALGERHDAVVQLAVDRWQELVGARVTLDGLDPLAGPRHVELQCSQPCDIACPERVTGTSLRALVTGAAVEVEPPVAGSPEGVRDLRGTGAVLASLAALVHADRGVVALVADTARRRVLLDTVLAPERLGAEVAVLGGSRCHVPALRTRLARASDRPLIALLDYATLRDVQLPPDVHVALVDPPADHRDVAWTLARSDGRWLHLLWGAEEVEFARSVAKTEWTLRPVAAAIWRALQDGTPRAWGPELDALLLGSQDPLRSPGCVARSIRALIEAGYLSTSGEAIWANPGITGSLDETPTSQEAGTTLTGIHAFLDRADTLIFGDTAISLENVRRVG
jgi:single-stranded-DNA-specific exonuclease